MKNNLKKDKKGGIGTYIAIIIVIILVLLAFWYFFWLPDDDKRECNYTYVVDSANNIHIWRSPEKANPNVPNIMWGVAVYHEPGASRWWYESRVDGGFFAKSGYYSTIDDLVDDAINNPMDVVTEYFDWWFECMEDQNNFVIP